MFVFHLTQAFKFRGLVEKLSIGAGIIVVCKSENQMPYTKIKGRGKNYGTVWTTFG
jgi:hypothetical protein